MLTAAAGPTLDARGAAASGRRAGSVRPSIRASRDGWIGRRRAGPKRATKPGWGHCSRALQGGLVHTWAGWRSQSHEGPARASGAAPRGGPRGTRRPASERVGRRRLRLLIALGSLSRCKKDRRPYVGVGIASRGASLLRARTTTGLDVTSNACMHSFKRRFCSPVVARSPPPRVSSSRGTGRRAGHGRLRACDKKERPSTSRYSLRLALAGRPAASRGVRAPAPAHCRNPPRPAAPPASSVRWNPSPAWLLQHGIRVRVSKIRDDDVRRRW